MQQVTKIFRFYYCRLGGSALTPYIIFFRLADTELLWDS